MITTVPEATPTLALAATVATEATGRTPVEIRRFSTGAAHYVFEALFAGGGSVVVRMGTPMQRVSMADALRLNRLLRPLGVPLPDVVVDRVDQSLPWIVLERLPGTDLGDVIGTLSDASLSAVAHGIVEAQAIAARVASAGRYGYAAAPELAPHAAWSGVLDANLDRSRARINAAGLFRSEPVDAVTALVAETRAELDSVPAIAFLHDTTTRNVIIAPVGTLSGIVDVDDLCFGDPRYAPALTLAVLTTSGGPAGYVEEWMRAANHRDDRVFRLYVALFLVDLMSEHGQRLNGNERPSTPRARNALLREFARAMHHARA